ncbi:hypothetical protein B2A_08378, partial [mine drainage metagenome]
ARLMAMMAPCWDVERARNLVADLLRPGLLGIYDRLAVYEVFGVPKGSPPINVLSVVVVEDLAGVQEDNNPVMLTAQRIRVDGFPGWTFGVARSHRLLKRLDESLAAFGSGCGWTLSGKTLGVGPLEVERPMFVARDGTQEVPINRLLKNNFWSGSHVIRLSDPSKAALLPFR